MTRIAALSIAVAALSTPALTQDRPSVRLEPGLWKVLIKFTQDDKPLPDKTENRCYSPAEVDDPVATFATLFPNQQCSRSHEVSDKTLAFAAVCADFALSVFDDPYCVATFSGRSQFKSGRLDRTH